MNHVDRGGQLRSYYKYDYPCAVDRGRHLHGLSSLTWPSLIAILLNFTDRSQSRRDTNQREWRECIYNQLFNAYGHDSQARQRYRPGDERHLQNPELQREHIDRHIKSDYIACQGWRQGQLRAKGEAWSPLTETSGNKKCTESFARLRFVMTNIVGTSITT